MSKSKLKVGVIGVGMGRGHAEQYLAHPRVASVVLSDVNAERLAQAGAELKITRLYQSPDEMLAKEKLDLVSIAVPNKFHKPLTLAALKAGCHILCEKPMAMNGKEAREMRDAARRAGKRLMINFSFRFTEQSWALKQEIESGTLGDVYFGRTIWHRRRGLPGFGGWFGQKALSGGGPLIDLGVHRLDLALWLMGYPQPVWVMGAVYDPIGSAKATREGKAFDVEDMAVGMIRFANGAALVVEASWAANIKERELMETRLLGTRAGMIQRNVAEGYGFEAEIYVDHDGRQFDMALHPPLPGVKCAYHHIVDCILDDTPHTATAEEGIIVMDLLDAIYASAKTGAPVHIGKAGIKTG